MNEVLYTNIFFIIASFGTLVFILFTTLIMWQFLKVIISIKKIVEKIEQESDNIISDLAEVRSFTKKGVFVRELLKLVFLKNKK